ncbi:leucine-rich repeat-containing protein 24-like [Pollicipes pollicipes]|uniref:leucine-rich repeat-containing protein 24-like n=1 Tax=Pollicipes pollicipes TaxID=41117 RepID=UPI0018854F83|nr:leucine-rich repeat-containing protein 24-like [Pollicipes pollicipes]
MRWCVLCVALVVLVAVARAAQCPSVCSCRWKYGKQTVECRAGGLRAVPEGLDPGTQVLELSGNELRELPAEVFRRAGLLNLQRIFLANCRLRTVDDSAFAGLTNLVDLDLSGNTLTAIPQRSLLSVPALRELKMANNAIQRVEADTFSAVPGLVKLDLSDCQIFEVDPAAFDPLDILESLKISGNRLQALPERTVVALRRVHNVELHANPWECDCRLRPMRDWLQRHNIPYPIAPSCHGPPRLAGRSFKELSADDFACRPQLLPMVREVAVTADDNATLTCRIGAVPQAQLSWFWRGQQLDNSTRLDGGRRPVIVEEGRSEERVSRLVIPAVRAEDAAADFHCVGVNPAGDAETNFTLTVGARLALLAPLDAGQIAAITGGLLLALVVGITLVILFLRRTRHMRQDDKAKRPPPGPGGVVNVETAPDDDVNPVQKPPRLTELSYSRYGASNGHAVPSQSAVYVRGPDLINEIDGRRMPAPTAVHGAPAGGYGLSPAGYDASPAGYGASPVGYGASPAGYGASPAGYGAYPADYGTPAPPYQGRGQVNPLADDSYELQQLPSTSDSDPERLDPAVYGYPADYGLPMPEMAEPAYGPAAERLAPPPAGLRPVSTSSAETALNTSRDSRGELSTSRDSVGSGPRRRGWQMGVPAGTDV